MSAEFPNIALPTMGGGPPREEAFVFTGSGPEYFRIWIVNLILSIVTLGIYSAWAKVRRLEYFYRNTRVAGASFDYHGRPLAILKGRIVAVLLFGGYSVAGAISPVAGLLAFVVLAGVMPFLIHLCRQRIPNSVARASCWVRTRWRCRPEI